MTVIVDQLPGRADELERLTQAITQLTVGPAEMLALVGEPGIGKSRLIAEALGAARGRERLVLSGRAAELERDLPFGVFVDALDPYLGSLGWPRFRALTDSERTDLASVFPALEAFAPATPRRGDGRSGCYRAVSNLLELLSRERPLILVLDDLHWADQASIELLGHLLRHRPCASLLVVGALRHRQAPSRLQMLLAAAERDGVCTRIELGPLSREGAEPLLASVTDRELRDALLTESGGNPFYLEQLARSAPNRRGPPALSTALPDVPGGVRDALAAELAAVPTRSRLILNAAAVAGDPFPTDLVADVAEAPQRDVLRAIDRAIVQGLVRTTPVPGYFAFRHPIVRHAVYELTPPAWRVGAHARAAVALESRGASAAARAHHVERSASVGDAVAVKLLTKAARETSALAPASAAQWFGAAVRLLGDDADPGRRVALLVALAMALTAAGALEQASETLSEVLALLPADQSLLRARVVTGMTVVERLLGGGRSARRALVPTLDQLADSPSVESAALSIELAADRYFDGDWDGMQEPARRAHALARQVEDVSLSAAAAAVLGLAHINAGRRSDALLLLTEAVRLLDGLANDELALHLGAAHWVGWCAHHLERYDEVVRLYERSLALARAHDQIHLVVPTLLGLVISTTWLGRLEAAQEGAAVAIETAHLLDADQMLAMTYALRAWVAVRAGGLEQAVELASTPVDGCRDAGSALHWPLARGWLAQARIEAGAPARGRNELLQAAGGLELPRIEPCQRAYYYAVLTCAELARGDAAAAEGWSACAQTAAGPYELAGGHAWALRAAAEVALARGDANRAAATALESVQAATGTHPLEAERSRLVAGRALAARGLHVDAVAALQEARGALLDYGARRLADLAARELRRLGVHVPRSGARGNTVSGLGSLSRRELEVARLVTDRLTNRQIAERLIISEKTVERHLSHIFEKLIVDSRVEVARAVERADGASV